MKAGIETDFVVWLEDQGNGSGSIVSHVLVIRRHGKIIVKIIVKTKTSFKNNFNVMSTMNETKRQREDFRERNR